MAALDRGGEWRLQKAGLRTRCTPPTARDPETLIGAKTVSFLSAPDNLPESHRVQKIGASLRKGEGVTVNRGQLNGTGRDERPGPRMSLWLLPEEKPPRLGNLPSLGEDPTPTSGQDSQMPQNLATS